MAPCTRSSTSTAKPDKPVAPPAVGYAIHYSGAPFSQNTKLALGFIARTVLPSTCKAARAHLQTFESGRGIRSVACCTCSRTR